MVDDDHDDDHDHDTQIIAYNRNDDIAIIEDIINNGMEIIEDSINNGILLNIYAPNEKYDNYDKFTNLLFINISLEQPNSLFSDLVNNNTYPIVYDYFTDRESIIDFIDNFKNIERIAFAFHGSSVQEKYRNNSSINNSFINNEKYYTIEDISDDNQHVFSGNVLFVKNLIQQFSLTNIDFLACNTLFHNDWKKYFDLLQIDSNVIICF